MSFVASTLCHEQSLFNLIINSNSRLQLPSHLHHHCRGRATADADDGGAAPPANKRDRNRLLSSRKRYNLCRHSNNGISCCDVEVRGYLSRDSLTLSQTKCNAIPIYIRSIKVDGGRSKDRSTHAHTVVHLQMMVQVLDPTSQFDYQ
jgi:hypothetical protein